MFQIIVPKKRAAILIDRLMVALKKAIEEEAEAAQGVSDGSVKSTYTLRPEDAVRTVHTFGFFLRMRNAKASRVLFEKSLNINRICSVRYHDSCVNLNAMGGLVALLNTYLHAFVEAIML